MDGRSYRGPRGVDASIPGGEFLTREPVPAALVETQNAGRNANGGNPPETVSLGGEDKPNSRRDSPAGSLLGAEQKQWLTGSLRASESRWKVVCNDVPLMRFGFDMSFRDYGSHNDLWWTDAWDGYPLERRELMTYIAEEGIANVISLTGDRHAHFAGVVHDDFDGDSPRAVAAEFAGSAICSGPRVKNQGNATQSEPELHSLILLDGTRFGYPRADMPSLNAWLLFGAGTAATLSETGDEQACLAAGGRRRQSSPSVRRYRWRGLRNRAVQRRKRKRGIRLRGRAGHPTRDGRPGGLAAGAVCRTCLVRR